jgi:hypothetical protein
LRPCLGACGTFKVWPPCVATVAAAVIAGKHAHIVPRTRSCRHTIAVWLNAICHAARLASACWQCNIGLPSCLLCRWAPLCWLFPTLRLLHLGGGNCVLANTHTACDTGGATDTGEGLVHYAARSSCPTAGLVA